MKKVIYLYFLVQDIHLSYFPKNTQKMYFLKTKMDMYMYIRYKIKFLGVKMSLLLKIIIVDVPFVHSVRFAWCLDVYVDLFLISIQIC